MISRGKSLYRILLCAILITQAKADISATKKATLEDVDWVEIKHCKATYYQPSVQTETGRLLAETDGWKI